MPLEDLPMIMPAAFLVIGVFAPGQRASRLAALGIGASLLVSAIFPFWPTAILWTVVWIGLAWFIGAEDARSSARAGGAESGAIAFFIGAAVLGLLLTAAVRQQLPPSQAIRVAVGLAFVGLAVLQLMLRRNVTRAAAAFGALALGVHVLLDVARHAAVGGGGGEMLGVPLAAALSAGLAIRLGRTRREVAGNATVSDAHDLHD